jgi:uncharacterized protein
VGRSLAQKRRQDFNELVRRAEGWATTRPDVLAIGVAGSWARGLVGSWARGAERMDSDVNLAVVVNQVAPYVQHDDWVPTPAT